jgi:hypothetical protein
MVCVIFLDIDGVLNCTDTPNPLELPYIVKATACLQQTDCSHARKDRSYIRLAA